MKKDGESKHSATAVMDQGPSGSSTQDDKGLHSCLNFITLGKST